MSAVKLGVQLLIVAALLFVAYKVYVLLDTKEEFAPTIERPAYAPIQTRPDVLPPMDVASSGPNAPTKAANIEMPPKELNDPLPNDPLAEGAESADAPERLRHPERAFGARLPNTDTELAVESGIASVATATTTQAIQHFTPEGITNGGLFFGGVAAMDQENPNYTAF